MTPPLSGDRDRQRRALTSGTGGFSSDYTLVPDAAYGYRAWDYDKEAGILESVFILGRWDVVNTATCKYDSLRLSRGYNTHRLEECICGFYSYHNIDDVAYTYMPVHGVVKISGKTVVGTRGFRSSKAEIVALSVSSSHRFFRITPVTKPFFVTSAVFAVIAAVIAIIAFFTSRDLLGVAWAVFVPSLTTGFSAALGDLLARTTWPSSTMTRADLKKLRQNYPGVPIFFSDKKMLKHFPLTKVDIDDEN